MSELGASGEHNKQPEKKGEKRQEEEPAVAAEEPPSKRARPADSTQHKTQTPPPPAPASTASKDSKDSAFRRVRRGKLVLKRPGRDEAPTKKAPLVEKQASDRLDERCRAKGDRHCN